MQLTTFSTIASVASALAMMTTQAKAAPSVISCPEAARFGFFNVTAPSTVAYGDKLTVSYQRNCKSDQNIYPTSLTFDIGYADQSIPQAFVQVDGPRPVDSQKVGKLLEYTTTLPDITLSGFYKGDKLDFLGTIQYTQKGPHGGDVDYLYTFQQPFTYDRPSN